MQGATGLRSRRERPIELLRVIDRRARAAAQGQPGSVATGAEWVGIAVRLRGEAFLLARDETREVSPKTSPNTIRRCVPVCSITPGAATAAAM